MWDTIKDYLNSLLGALVVLISLIFIPEINHSKKRVIGAIVLFLGLASLGFDKINRDNKKDEVNTKRIKDDSLKYNKLNADFEKLSKNYDRDTSRFSDFKIQLHQEFHIRDSANTPVQIKNTIRI